MAIKFPKTEAATCLIELLPHKYVRINGRVLDGRTEVIEVDGKVQGKWVGDTEWVPDYIAEQLTRSGPKKEPLARIIKTRSVESSLEASEEPQVE